MPFHLRSSFCQDLNFFADNLWKLGMNLTAGKFIFLGDYVDRGMQGLECLAYLFSLKARRQDHSCAESVLELLRSHLLC